MANPEFQSIVKGTPMQAPASDEVLIRREGRAGRITINRPQALNALTLAMVHRIFEALTQWQSDPATELVVLDGAGDRALCAGGDVRALYDSRTEGSGLARAFWSDEYPERPDRPIPQAVCRHPGRYRHGWRYRLIGSREPSHRHRAL